MGGKALQVRRQMQPATVSTEDNTSGSSRDEALAADATASGLARPIAILPVVKGRRFHRAQSAPNQRSVPQPEQVVAAFVESVALALRIRSHQPRREVWPLLGLRSIWREVGKLVGRTDGQR
jgi:hypothetical protein